MSMFPRMSRDRRCGRVFAAVLALFGQKPLVAYVMVQEADLQRSASRCEQDRSATEEEVGRWELLRWVFRKRHLFLYFMDDVGVVLETL